MHNNSQNYVINQSRPQSPQWKKHNWKWRWEKTYVSCINIVTFILFYHNVIAKIKLFELSLNLKKMSYENWKTYYLNQKHEGLFVIFMKQI